MKCIGVTGGLGFIGTSLIPRLQRELGCSIRVLDNGTNPSGDLFLAPEVHLIEGDIRDQRAVDQFLDGVDTVIHLAAHTRVIDSIEEPALNYEINCKGTFTVLEAARARGFAIRQCIDRRCDPR